ncbi:DNA-3-methyladenine glycosylase family protein [Pseudomonadota bacterium]
MLTYDPGDALKLLSKNDKQLAGLIKKIGPFAIELHPKMSPFESLLRAIVYQQLSGKAAAAIHLRVRSLFKGSRVSPQAVYEIAPEKLRGAGLSRAKVLAVKDLADKSLTGIVPRRDVLARMSDDAIVSRLVEVRGVGRWTVEMMLIFQMGRADVLPIDDLGVRKGFHKVYGGGQLPTPKELAEYGMRWHPYRSVASWYLWRAADQVL